MINPGFTYYSGFFLDIWMSASRFDNILNIFVFFGYLKIKKPQKKDIPVEFYLMKDVARKFTDPELACALKFTPELEIEPPCTENSQAQTNGKCTIASA